MLHYFVDTNTFPDPVEAGYAAQALQQAADEWNNLGLGISITRAGSKATANFPLLYDAGARNTTECNYAEAFFPHQIKEPITVTNFALSPPERRILKNVFLHELCHVLGRRHEFALDETQQHQIGVQEDAQGAVQYMQRNPDSVMSYTSRPTLQQTDIDGVKKFYEQKPGYKINKSPIVDFKPQLVQ